MKKKPITATEIRMRQEEYEAHFKATYGPELIKLQKFLEKCLEPITEKLEELLKRK